DGFLDIFIGSVKGNNRLYINQKNGTFKIDSNFSGITEELKNVSVTKAGFFDYDNDGFIDLLICGEHTDKNGRGLFLYHNENTKTFKNSTEILPENIKTGVTFELFDYNDDGDIDILLAETSGNIALLRNDGGNLNHFIKIRLIGLRTGSAKNNYFGIGAKVEMRAGDLYNTAVVTKQDVHFGLGSKSEVDVLRITWTNGVPQNIFMPGRDKAIVEAQLLKGSCPFLYTWDGNEFVFVKDILWRSALGMPLGIMGGTTTYGFPEASDDYIKIPGELLKMQKNLYKLNITSELWETIYLDKIELIAVDHPDSTEIFVEEQFSPPPFPGLKIYHVDKKILPASATDGEGNDLLEYISEKDDKYIAGFKPTAYQGITEVHQLILDPGPSIKEDSLFIFLNGWIFPTDASINVAISQNPDIKVIQPVFQVVNNKGEWETVIENTGFPMGKDKTMIINMSGKFLSSDHRIRIITNMEIYWDYIFFSTSQISKASLNVIPLKIKRADIHYRGFSEMYRKGGRYGPHWFNYSVIDKTIGWRDLTGNYTRYGDVLALLKQTDNKYIISNAGDEISVSFSDSKNSEIKKGWKRDFLIRSVGWVKDGDLNTLTGNTVEPLPFHGMTQYPPSRDEKFPESDDYKIYMKKYNTRVVTREGFINKLKK
ncbi:MAG: CRTAC1 family protein, partial [Bacteroidales bacterium]